MAPSGIPASPITESQDPASKRKRTNRLAKLKQCKREAQREQWLSHQEAEREHGEGNLHADTNDPGQVVHPEPAETKPLLPANSTITWASLLNSGISSQMQQRIPSSARVWTPNSERDPEILEVKPSSWRVNIRIRQPEQKDLCRDPGPATCDGCGDTDASPKSCGDRSPKSKESKVGRGSRRYRGHRRRNSKENECFDNLETRGPHGQVEGKRAHAHGQKQGEDGWEAAADTLGVHTIEKESFLNVLQPQVLPPNNQQRTKTSSLPPLLGMKPRKHQQSAHGRAWMQGDSRRPTCLPRPTKQHSSSVDVCVLTNLNNVLEKPQCLICTEDLDNTDTSFDGCECGFNICLFCYHKIEQETGRCPGCRGVYKRDVAAKPACLLPR